MREVPVVVVGAGPAGLVAAITLARAGVETLLVERRRAPSAVPRANTISTWSMELLRTWGLEPQVREHELDVVMAPRICHTLASAADGHTVDAGFPSREASSLISPTSCACVPQSALEPVLERHLRSLPAARVQRGVEVVGLDADDRGATLALRDTDGVRHVRAQYVIAADGIRSTVRALAGIPIAGREVDERLAVAFRAPLWDLVGAVRHVIYGAGAVSPSAFFVPVAAPDRWVLGLEWEGGAAPTVAALTDLIRRGAGDPRLEPRIDDVSTVVYGVHLAERFCAGRVFVAGDAAHRVTPRGAIGMSLAIRGAYDLAWKLSWVLRGWAGPGLLDSYEVERRPVVQHAIARTSDPSGSTREAERALAADLGGRIPHVWVDAERSTLDLLGDGLTLFTGPDGAAWSAGAVDERAPVTVRRLDVVTAQAIGVPAGGALLVRPDGQRAQTLTGSPANAWSTAASSSQTSIGLVR